jgi:hypothetical protein
VSQFLVEGTWKALVAFLLLLYLLALCLLTLLNIKRRPSSSAVDPKSVRSLRLTRFVALAFTVLCLAMVLTSVGATIDSQTSLIVFAILVFISTSAVFAEQRTTWKYFSYSSVPIWPRSCSSCGAVDHSKSSCTFPSAPAGPIFNWTPFLETIPDEQVKLSQLSLDRRLRRLQAFVSPSSMPTEPIASSPFSDENIDRLSFVELVNIARQIGYHLPESSKKAEIGQGVKDFLAFKKKIKRKNPIGTEVNSDFPLVCTQHDGESCDELASKTERRKCMQTQQKTSDIHLNEVIKEFNALNKDNEQESESFFSKWIGQPCRDSDCNGKISWAKVHKI